MAVGTFNALFMGHSHLDCFTLAANATDAVPEGSRMATISEWGLGLIDDPDYQRRQRHEMAAALSQILDTPVDSNDDFTQVRAAHPFEVVLSVAGNHHIALLGRYAPILPYDVVLPDEPDLAIDPDATITPYHLLHSMLRRLIEPYFESVRRVIGWVGAPVYVLESPPPLSDVAQIQEGRAALHIHNKRRAAKMGKTTAIKLIGDGIETAPLMLRYKLWRIVSTVTAELCQEAGATWVPVPASLRSPAGRFLAPGLHRDFSHGNHLFAAGFIEHLWTETFVGAPSDGNGVMAPTEHATVDSPPVLEHSKAPASNGSRR